MRVRVKNVGKIGWRSWDVDGSELSAAPGQVVEMSEERAIKPMADYVSVFELVEMETPATEQEPPMELLVEPQEPRHRRSRR